ncbi:MAG: FG-GAP repeat protein, partial [Gammaproteobacteria bacterium]|nr:FG-GAP repeat protein [Gammaproteobacteria bacterium]
LEGDTLAVGAHQEGSSSTGINSTPNDDLSPSSVGAVYVFTRTGTSWAQEAYIKSSNPGSNDNFGYAVDLSGDTLAVGAWGEEGTSSGVGGNPALTGSASAGAVFIFTRSGSTWSPQEYIKAKTTSSSERFGWSVSLDKDTLVVGAPGEKAASTNTGAINVYTRSGTTWTLHSEHNTSNKQQSDEFGWAVGVSGDTIVGSAFHEDSNETGTTGTGADNSMSNSGAAYIFQ